MAAVIDYSERSAFYKYVPARVMDEYFRFLCHTETGMTTEDRQVAENTNNNAVQNNLSSFMKELTTDLAEDTAEFDMEVAEIFNTKPELKMENCQSPKEPWIPQISDDRTAAADRGNLEMDNSFIQQITPIIISLSPSTSHSSLTTPETASDVDINLIQDISPSPKHSHFHQSSFEAFSETIRNNGSCTEKIEENLAYPEPNVDLLKHTSTFPGSDADSPGKQKPSMEELRRMVLDRSADRPGLDRFTQTEEEQFAEILEDFLEENKDLPPEIRDNILDMLTKTRETVAEQQEGILYTAEIYKGESDDEVNMDEYDRAADDEVKELINEIELPDLHTEQPDLPTAVTSESLSDVLLDMETNMDEFDRAADDEIMDLINEIDLSDLAAASDSANDVLLDMGTNVRESMAELTEGIVYSTYVFIGEDDERLLAEFERAVNSGLVSEDTNIAKLPDPTAYQIGDPSRSKFKPMKDVDVEMDSTGQEIYDEIAAFFGCK